MPVVWALLVSSVGKWLSKGFEDNKNMALLRMKQENSG